MKVITIEDEAFQQIVNRLEAINTKLIKEKDSTPLSEVWLDGQDVCQLLHVSKRLLQSYRDTKRLPFSQFGAKIWYKASDIEVFLNDNYNKK